jgi:hypothetical protein
LLFLKHKPDTATGAADAKHAASGGDKFIRLIDGDEFSDNE